MRYSKNKDNRIGKTFLSKNGDSQCVCIDYRNNHDCDIMFLDCGLIREHVDYGNLQRGSFKSPYSKSIAGVGYIGFGDGNLERPFEYKMWSNMLLRCYETRTDRRRDANYIDCYVSEEWHNFQNFLLWYDENIKKYNVNEPLCLDKDLLYKNNKIYSQYSCLLIPERINIFTTKSQFARGEYPIGVHLETDTGKFKAQCNNPFSEKNTNRNLGRYDTPEEAFNVYKNKKESYAKELAGFYKNKIDERAINALYKYRVDIDD